MAKSPRGKGTKAAAVKRKPATTKPRRTKLQGVKDMGPIVIDGTFDDGAISALERAWQDANGAPRELTIVNGRRFLWWTVARERLRQTVIVKQHEVGKSEDGMIAVTVPMQCDGPSVTILSPWWERTLYAIARIWS